MIMYSQLTSTAQLPTLCFAGPTLPLKSFLEGHCVFFPILDFSNSFQTLQLRWSYFFYFTLLSPVKPLSYDEQYINSEIYTAEVGGGEG